MLELEQSSKQLGMEHADMTDKDRPEFVCPLDVGMFGNVAQFLIRDCETKQEAIKKLKDLGFQNVRNIRTNAY